MAEIKEKLKDDPQKMNKEIMKLYSTYGVNPAGGCLPLLLQMPIFIALWGFFSSALELRQQPFILWIKDLSQPDVIYDLGFKLPMFGIQEISGLALLMGITTFIQQKMTMKIACLSDGHFCLIFKAINQNPLTIMKNPH